MANSIEDSEQGGHGGARIYTIFIAIVEENPQRKDTGWGQGDAHRDSEEKGASLKVRKSLT